MWVPETRPWSLTWPRSGPMLSPRVPNLVPIPGPRMERETPGQRPRPNYGHPQSEDQDSTPRERAHWFRDLYAAMGSNAVPASTRAAVRWCYALLEHESIKQRRTPLRGVVPGGCATW